MKNDTRASQRPVIAAGRRSYTSRELFRGAREVLIEHAGHCYLLRITRQNKLILTK